MGSQLERLLLSAQTMTCLYRCSFVLTGFLLAACGPNPDTSTNFQSRFTVQGTRRSARPKPMPTEPPRITRQLAQAEAWMVELDTGAVASRAAIAAREGVSAMRVGSILRLLNLHPRIQAWIRGLPPGTRSRAVTERALRGIARMSAEAQLVAVDQRWPGWDGAVAGKSACSARRP